MDIAVISLAFSNSKMVRRLTKRGNAIMNGKIERVNTINKDIKNILMNEKERHEINQPCKAFIVF